MRAENTYVGKFIISIGKLINLALPISVGLALLFFFWGVAVFILKADQEKERQAGKDRMLWGVVALFVITATWALVAFLGNIFGVNTHTSNLKSLSEPEALSGGSVFIPECDGSSDNPC